MRRADPRSTSEARRRSPRRVAWALVAVAGLLAVAARAPADAPAHGIATPHPLATEAAADVLAAGGNAFDAAVAIAATLAVVEPYGSGLGGGGFWLLHEAAGDRDVMIDSRERAPLAATADMFIGADGEVDRELALDSALAAAIPGEAAAFDHIASRYGELPLERLLEPAIRLARDGFPVDQRYRRMAGFRAEVLQQRGSAADVFLASGDVPGEGERIRQPDLADTLERLAREGREGFYQGAVARRMVEAVREHGGIWTQQDLREYEVVEREPIAADYRGMRVVSAPPPSSGGIALAQIFHILSGYELASLERDERMHLVVEAMRRAYHDRARYLGDTDFVDVPVERLTDPRYAAGLRATMRRDRATPSDTFVGPGEPEGGRNTSHFSVVDRDGNRVAATLSLNYPFGSGFMPADTGVVLNDHMDDFTARVGEANAYGLIQAPANRIEPGKRMLSSMSPTFLEHDDRVAVIGTPGGSRIISTVALAGLAFHAGGGVDDLVGAPRYHHQYLPDRIQHEPDGFPEDLLAALAARGHEVEELDRTWGNSQAVVIDGDGRFAAMADPRGVGDASAAGRVGRR